MASVRSGLGLLKAASLRPTRPVPLIFALTAGGGVGLGSGAAMLVFPHRPALIGLAALDLVALGIASLVAAWLVRRTRQPLRETVEIVRHLSRDRFNQEVALPDVKDPEAQEILGRVWELGRSLTETERRLAFDSRHWQRKYVQARDLIDLIAELNRALGLRPLFERLAAGVSHFYAGDGVAIWVQARTGEDLTLLTAVEGHFPERLSAADGWVDAALAGRLRYVPLGSPTEPTSLLAPLVDAHGAPVGLLALTPTRRMQYSQDEQAFLQTVLSHASLAIQNARAYDRTEALARQDGLTGLLNRREFDRLLEVEVARATRYQRQFSLVMLDIDHFKRVNDERGHPAGDWALQRLAEVLRMIGLRASDSAFRIGGEEFAILLAETDKPGAMALAERVRQSTEEVEFFEEGDPITVSLGVAAFPADGLDGPSLLDRADRALYQAKHSGRNQVVAA